VLDAALDDEIAKDFYEGAVFDRVGDHRPRVFSASPAFPRRAVRPALGGRASEI